MPQSRSRRGTARARADPAKLHVTIVGLGPIGRELAVQLVARGVARLRLIDAGRVTPSVQLAAGYNADDVGRPRVHVAAERCHRINPRLYVRTSRRLRRLRFGAEEVVFDCTDSTQPDLRRFRQRADAPRLWTSAVVLSQRMHILTAYDEHSRRVCISAMRREGRAPARPTPIPMHVAAIAAGLLVAQFDRFLRGLSPIPVTQFDPSESSPTLS